MQQMIEELKRYKKVLVCYSGGMDSTFLAGLCKSLGIEVTLGAFDIKSKNYKHDETPILKEIHQLVIPDIELQLFDFPNTELFVAKMAKQSDYSETNTIEKDQVDFIVGWKLLMESILLSYGAANSYDAILFGHMTWNAHYADEFPVNMELLRNLYKEVYDRVAMPQVLNPFYTGNICKSNIVKYNHDVLNLNLFETYSCAYTDRNNNNQLVHCGECTFCAERKMAYKDANVPDYTRYRR